MICFGAASAARTFTVCAFAATLGALAAPGLAGDPVLYPANGHYYAEIPVPEGITWEDARLAAEAMSFLGVQGHLATLTDPDENQFIVGALPIAVVDLYWLGGFQNDDELDPLAGWNWVTGEAWDYTNWAQFEPNDGDGVGPEQFLSLWRADWGDPVPAPDTVLGVWNDEPGWFAGPGYVVEFPIGACSPADLAPPFAVLNFSDAVAFITAFSKLDPSADLAAPIGELNFSDVVEFLSLFDLGCP